MKYASCVKYLGEGSEQFARMLGVDRLHLSRIEYGALTLIHESRLLDKIKQLKHHDAILALLSETQRGPNPVQRHLDHAASSYDFKAAP